MNVFLSHRSVIGNNNKVFLQEMQLPARQMILDLKLALGAHPY
jgi:hypothetical protein